MTADTNYSPWPGQNKPHTAAGETRFIRKLGRMGGTSTRRRVVNPPESLRRSYLSACVTALRAGQDPADVLNMMAKVHPLDLRDAYRAADRKLRAAVRAWDRLIEDPSPEALEKYGESAYRIAPTLVTMLREDPTIVVSDLRRALARADEQVAAAEKALEKSRGNAREASDLLMAPGTGLWNGTCFIPRRVGQLTPTRLAHLLEENQ